MQVEADTVWCDICQENHTKEWYHDLYVSVANMIFKGNLFDEAGMSTGGSIYFDVSTLLQFDISPAGVDKNGNYVAAGPFNELWKTAESLYNALKPFGTVLVLVFFLLELMGKLMQDQFSGEQFIKSFIKLAAMWLIILNAYDLLTGAFEFCTAIYNKVADPNLFKTAESKFCALKMIEKKNMLETLGNTIILFFPQLLMMIAKLVVRIIVWVRILNIILYTTFLPIGMADMVNGVESSGFRYFKKTVAQVLQGAVIYAIIVGYNLVYTVIAGNLTAEAGWATSVILAFLVITMMFRSSTIAEEVMGA